jgi:hypothetical protein
MRGTVAEFRDAFETRRSGGPSAVGSAVIDAVYRILGTFTGVSAELGGFISFG